MKTINEIRSAGEIVLNELRTEAETFSPELAAMNTPKSSQVQKRVWVVDDDETVLMLAEDVLTAAGFQVATFSDPARAVEAFEREHPDIIVLDVMMPGMNGFEFVERLRANPAGMDVPVLMATSLDDSDSITHAYEAGATNFATKPLNWAIETQRLRYMLRVAETAQLLKAKELETRLAKEDWERTFNSFSDVVTLLSPDLKLLRANLATVKALKRPLTEIIGQQCYQLFHGADAPCEACPVRQAMATGLPVSAEKHYSRPAADFLLTGAPVTDKAGQLLHVVHIARDLTEQKLLETQYRHAQKMEAMGTLAGGIAHDFNNLLMVISGSAEMIRNDLPANSDQSESADLVLEAAQRGATLTKQLLAFSRKGVAKSENRSLQINEVIRDMQKMLQRLLPKNVSIHAQYAAELRPINGSADQLYQVVMNLAVNASHAMPAGGVITIATRNVHLDPSDCHLHPETQPGDFVQVAVSDTGHGMDAQTMQRIFEPFFTTKQVGEGTGLGLSVVYGIVKSHGGHIWCHSEVGIGTTFKIHLPALPATGEAIATQAQHRLNLQGGHETILIVEDEASLRAVVQRAFIKLGYTIISADDGESALLRYDEAKHHIRLAVIDLGMPGMGGWECLKRLRIINPTLPILLTTGYGGQDLPERARQEGANGLINKPYQLEELFTMVRKILDRG